MSKKQMDERIGIENYSLFSKGTLINYKLIFNNPKCVFSKEGYASVEPDIDSVVEGIIYEINNIGLEKLDVFELVFDKEYKREQISVDSEKGKIICEVYIATNTQDDLKPSKAYIEKLLVGRSYLSPGYIKMLESVETID
jgi:gamma-glutamylcyclotransferase (GGCT)/AIG2-like uncharacterized protein YtfP